MLRFHRRWQYLLAFPIFIVLVILAVGFHAYTRFITIIHPLSNLTCCPTPTDLKLPIVQVRLVTNDGLQLACWSLPSQNHAAIILLHGEGGNRQTMLAYTRLFAQHGYGVLVCDRRAHGASGGVQRSWGWLDVRDVATLLSYLQHQQTVDPARIGVFGFSMGAQIGLRAAGSYPTIHAVVADGPVPATAADLFPPSSLSEWFRVSIDWLDNWFVDRFLERTLQMSAPPSVAETLAHQVAQPVLLISTGLTGHGREVRQVAWFYALARAPKQLWEIPDVGHGEGFDKHTAEYTKRVVGFFNMALLGQDEAVQP